MNCRFRSLALGRSLITYRGATRSIISKLIIFKNKHETRMWYNIECAASDLIVRESQ